MKALLRRPFLLVLLFLLAIIFYNLWDNNRFVVVTQDVPIPGLDPAFDGFRILQISDLHSRYFGPTQQTLVDAINSLDYDMIALTGDMAYDAGSDPQAFFDLLAGLRNKPYIFYTSGNTGPYDVNLFTGDKTADGLRIEQAGGILLDHPYAIRRGQAVLWISDFFSADRARGNIEQATQALATTLLPEDEAYFTRQLHYYQALTAEFGAITPPDTLIAVTHYPLSPPRLENPTELGLPPYDLVLAGHYHGGQVRLPLIGAIYIPSPPGQQHFFPPENVVSGLAVWGGTSEYISRGLGASGPILLVSFRLFNTPEINLLTLKSK